MAQAQSGGLSQAQTFFKEAIKLRNEGKLADCCAYLVEGLRNICRTDEERLPYFALLGSVVPYLSFEENIFGGVFIPTSTQFWSRLIKYLAANNDWPAILFYTLGVRPEVILPLQHLALKAPTDGVRISGLINRLSDLDLASWGIRLAIHLLWKGADVDGVAADDKEPVAVAAVKVALRTGNNNLLKYVMENNPKVRSQIDKRDPNGDTALHIAVKSVKVHTSSGQDLVKHLLSYGASVTMPDSSGKLPNHYTDSRTLVYSYLQKAANVKESELKEKVKVIKEKGNKCLQQDDSAGALRNYKEAITMAENSNSLRQELAVLHTNCSIVNSKLGLHKDALSDARVAVQYDKTYYKSYWKMGQCLTNLEEEKEALTIYVKAIKEAKMGEDVKVNFLVATVNLLPLLQKKGLPFANEMKTLLYSYNELLTKVLTRCLESSSYESIRVLILGQEYISSKCSGRLQLLSQSYPTMNSGLTAQLKTFGIDLGPFLKTPEYEWMEDLIIVLMLSGARRESLTLNEGDTPLHAAVEFCVKSGSTVLTEYLLEKQFKTEDVKNIQDTNGQSLFHRICELCPTGESAVGSRLIELLVKLNINPTLENMKKEMATDLVPKESNLYRLLTQAINNFVQHLKEEGKSEYMKEQYVTAAKKYSTGIHLVTRTTKDTHTLAILHGNRAECHLKVDMSENAVEDSRLSIAYDSDWHRAHWRLAKSLRALAKYREAANAYVDTWNCLATNGNNSTKMEILGDLFATLAVCKLSKGARVTLVRKLRGIRGEMVVKLTYDLLKKKSSWPAAEIAYSSIDMGATQSSSCPHDLRPLCNAILLQRNRWVVHFMVLLLRHGADHNSITFYDNKDTYLHGGMFTVWITGEIDVLMWLVDNIAIPARQMSIQDTNGNTLLHAIVLLKSPPDLKVKLIHLLVPKGTDPHIRNSHGYTAVELVNERETSVTRAFKQAMCVRPGHGVNSKAAQKHPIGFCDAESSKSTETKKLKKKKNSKDAENHDCKQCETTLKEADLHVTLGQVTDAINVCVSILLLNGEGLRHREITNKSMDVIVTVLGNSSIKELPASLKDVKPKQVKTVIERLAVNGKWAHVILLVDHYGENKLPKNFGKYISVTSLITNGEAPESLKMNMMTLLQRHGANISKEKKSEETLQLAFMKEEFQIVSQMIDAGVSPSSMSVTPGDTPLHASLMLGLTKGNFQVFYKLNELKNKQKRHFLNLKSVDSQGDTLLHIACRQKYNKHSLKAVEILCKLRVPADETNKEGRRPIEYLQDRNDRRAEYLRVIGGTALSTSKANTEDIDETAAVITTSDEKNSEMTTVKEVSRYTKKRKIERLGKDGITSKLKEKVRRVILGRPDASNIFFGEQTGPQATHFQPEEREDKIQQKLPTVKSDRELALHFKLKDQLEKNSAEMFVDLTWEVECTWEVIQFLQDADVAFDLKYKAIKEIHLLAKGKWKPYQCIPVDNIEAPIQLFEVKLGKTGKIIWEVGVAFSSRCSEDPGKRLAKEGHTFAVKSGRIYSEIIRIWDIVFGVEDELCAKINDIVTSHRKGKRCLLEKKIVCQGQLNQRKMSGTAPMLFTEVEDTSEENHKEIQFYPPASANKCEYNVIKFYSFSAAMIKSALKNNESEMQFPFRVTDVEQAIIQLRSDAPILLLGRSGTGKTTCCMFRLWTNFITYWHEAQSLGEPFLPRKDVFQEDHSEELDSEESNTNDSDDNDENKGSVQVESIVKKTDMSVYKDQLCEPQTFSVEEIESTSQESVCDETHTMVENEFEKEAQKDITFDADKHDEAGDIDDENDSGPYYDHLHQIFVTKNPVLCAEVNKNFYQLCQAYEELSDHVRREAEDLPPKLQDVDDNSYPLFLTSKKLLLMLDASLEPPYFFDRNADGSLSVQVEGWGSQDNNEFAIPSLDSDDEDQENIDGGCFTEGKKVEQTHVGTKKQRLDRRREVTYDIFEEEIHPKIIKNVSTVYHPSLVWTEIMSFIKGSFEALSKHEGHLKEDEYIDLGRKRAPNFTGERHIVYELYERYAHYKKQNCLFDEADLVQNINKRLREVKEKPWIFHQLYVDETQDFTQSELFLLVRLIQHPNEMFLTGDTAQGIMRGISFRFHDLKSLFYHAGSILHPVGDTKLINVPTQIYQLTHNYRSHAGILSLATSILDILFEFFPESFDHLQPDQGLFMGPRPILLESCCHGDLAVLLQGNKRKTSHIEFGAHQAILVVNDSVKKTMPEDLSHGIVLTIYEAKGLEFDDVLLYNFFKDSQITNEWRVVITYLQSLAAKSKEKTGTVSLVSINEDVLKGAKSSRPLKFDPRQHKLLNSELKQLYTAITRARVNVWIFDEDEQKRAPMFEYFKARELVSSVTEEFIENGGDIVFAETSTTDDWIKRADEMMGQRLYEIAAKCYKMGHDTDRQKTALAYHQALQATRCQDNPREKKEGFILAAEKFLDCFEDKKASLCLQNAREFELAGLLYEKRGMHFKAAKMYHSCNKPVDESRCMEQLGHFHTAIDVLSKAELYEQAIDCLNRYTLLTEHLKRKRKAIPAVLTENKPGKKFTVERLTYKAANFYKKDNKEKMMEALERLPRIEDQIEFLKNTVYIEDAACLMVKEGKTTDAVEILLQYGKIEKALKEAQTGNNEGLLANCHYAAALEKIHDDASVDEITNDLDQCYSAYVSGKNTNGIGINKLTTACLHKSKDDAKTAFTSFQAVKPYANEAGMLEALDVMLQTSEVEKNTDFADVKALTRGVECLFNVMKALLKPASPEEKMRSQLYMKFYGLHKKDTNTLLVYPKQIPIWARNVPELSPLTNYLQQTTEKDKKKVSIVLCEHLIEVLNRWANYIKKYLTLSITNNCVCPDFKLGRECKNESCLYVHTLHTKETAFSTLEVLVWNVQFDRVLQRGINTMGELEASDGSFKELYMTINIPDITHRFDSCETLLDFLVPEDKQTPILTGNRMNKDISLLTLGSVPEQIHEYLKNYWGEKTDISRDDLWLERSKNTDWFLRATIFIPLFRLDMDIVNVYETLEQDLAVNQPPWLFKKKTVHALFIESNVESVFVQSLGRRLHDVYLWLKTSPVKAVIEFSKSVRFLCNKSSFSLFPRVSMFLLWNELFVCVSFLILARLSSTKQNFVLPASYLETVSLFDSTFDKNTPGIEEWIHRESKKNQHIEIIQNCIFTFCRVLHGNKLNLLKRLFTPKKSSEIKYLQAERCFTLAMTMSVNSDLFVSQGLKSALQAVMLDLELPADAPARFVKVVNAAKVAKDNKDIAKALHDFLTARGDEGLMVCQWDSRSRKHVSVHILENVEKEVMPEVLDIQSPETEEPLTVMARPQFTNEDVQDAEDLIATEEEREKSFKNLQKQKMERRKGKAAKTLQRFFRWLTMMGRLNNFDENSRTIVDRCTQQQLKEFQFNGSFCGVCGINLCERADRISRNISKNKASNGQTDQTDPTISLASAVSTTDKNPSEIPSPQTCIETHQTTAEHKENLSQFEQFAIFYTHTFVKKVPAIRLFILEKKLRDQAYVKEHYTDLELEIPRLVRQMTKVSELLETVMTERQWNWTTDLKKELSVLIEDYLKMKLDLDEKYEERKQAEQQDVTLNPHATTAAHPPQDEDEDEDMFNMDRPAQGKIVNRDRQSGQGGRKKQTRQKRKKHRRDYDPENPAPRIKQKQIKTDEEILRASQNFHKKRFYVQS